MLRLQVHTSHLKINSSKAKLTHYFNTCMWRTFSSGQTVSTRESGNKTSHAKVETYLHSKSCKTNKTKTKAMYKQCKNSRRWVHNTQKPQGKWCQAYIAPSIKQNYITVSGYWYIECKKLKQRKQGAVIKWRDTHLNLPLNIKYLTNSH